MYQKIGLCLVKQFLADVGQSGMKTVLKFVCTVLFFPELGKAVPRSSVGTEDDTIPSPFSIRCFCLYLTFWKQLLAELLGYM